MEHLRHYFWFPSNVTPTLTPGAVFLRNPRPRPFRPRSPIRDGLSQHMAHARQLISKWKRGRKHFLSTRNHGPGKHLSWKSQVPAYTMKQRSLFQDPQVIHYLVSFIRSCTSITCTTDGEAVQPTAILISDDDCTRTTQKKEERTEGKRQKEGMNKA
jgi:hypothetical protein